MLAALPGLADLTLTTNGSLLAEKAAALAEAGLGRVTVSLDSLDDEVFARLNDVRFPVARVLEGLLAAERAGLAPIKVNMVVRRGVNEDSILPMARFARERGYTLRFIEYMDVGHTNGWDLARSCPPRRSSSASSAELPLEPLPPPSRARWRAVGATSTAPARSASSPRSRDPSVARCTRARLTAEGLLYTCLFGVRGHDLRGPLRRGEDDAALRGRLAAAWEQRDDRYSEVRSEATEDAAQGRDVTHRGLR